MVASVSALTSAGQAASYYEADDYHAEGGLSPSAWFGAGADALGLSGDVDRDQFKAMLEGKIGGEQIGTMRDGQVEHRPGWDVTLSAPKSVSIMAAVAGDRRLVAAHSAATKVALAYVEQHMAATRIRKGGNVERHATDNLTIATFPHETSRALDPQLHTHSVILNATQDKEGNWRSLEPRAIYQLQKQIGAIYRQELAVNAARLGYEVIAGKDSMFEIAGVPEKAINALSQRTAAIDARLEERGTSREKASAAEKQMAALDTRDAKAHADQGDLTRDWRATANAAGFDEKARTGLVEAAETRAASAGYQDILDDRGAITADRAVSFAAEKLGERQSVFAKSALQEEAGRFGFGKVGHAAIAEAIGNARNNGELEPRDYLDKRGARFDGFTTRFNIENEKKLLHMEAMARGEAAPIASNIEAAKIVAHAMKTSAAFGHAWTSDQKQASTSLLTSRNRITAVQGYAGTAKTTTVLATYASEATARGVRVTALAPTASAAIVLGEALNMRGGTVARHLLTPEGKTQSGPVAWIVDEASMLSAHDMARLLVAADKTHARVVLVGDVQQLGSVGAGAAFAQLQSAGMETAKLTEIVRQTNPLTKEAVEASIEGDARRALQALDRGGGKIIAQRNPTDRMKAMAKDYAALSAKDQRRTIVIDPSRNGRDALNAEIRMQLMAKGRLSGDPVTMRTLESKGLTRAEAHDARSYEIGDIIRFARDYDAKGIERREVLTVTGIDPVKNAVRLEKADGQSVDWRPRQWGAAKSEAFTLDSVELMKGDRIEFTRNDRSVSRINGTRADVIAINTDNRTARIRLDNGKFQTLRLDTASDQHVRHGYVQTTHAAQGRTAKRVMIHADSRATNLVDQKMMYVAISRAKASASVYTDDGSKLITAIKERAGEKQVASRSELSHSIGVTKGVGLG